VIVSILVRRLREGKTYEDFREAWLPEKGFGWPTRVVTAQRMDDPRRSSRSASRTSEPSRPRGSWSRSASRPRARSAAKPDDAHLEEVAHEQLRRRSRIGEVIEPEVTRTFYVQLAEDDLT
jgi:hypothetical protein